MKHPASRPTLPFLIAVLVLSCFAVGNTPAIDCPFCGDFNNCTLDSCDTTTGTCRHDPVNCDDGNPCTTDSCSPFLLCSHVAVAAGTSCSDGSSCTLGDACNGSGLCVGQTQPAGTGCDDRNSCTTSDICDSGGQCIGTPLPAGASCDDGSLCTSGDACAQSQAGAVICQGVASTCSDSNPCTQDTCDPTTGQCAFPPVNCNDGNVCTGDSCDPATGSCVRTNVPGSCDDGNQCASGDFCSGGNCLSGGPTNCDDHIACTFDQCIPDTGCFHIPQNSACNDQNPCTRDVCETFGCNYHFSGGGCTYPNRCFVGICFPPAECGRGPAINCSDGNDCTTDSCDPAIGCVHQPVPGSTTCGVGACQRTVDCSGGTPQTCVPGTPTAEVCNGIDDDCDGQVDENRVQAECLINPSTLNLNAQGSSLSIECKLTDLCDPNGPEPIPGAQVDQAYIARADDADDPGDDVILPDPSTLTCPDPQFGTLFERGIVETARDNSARGATFKFVTPNDGDCRTLEGDRQDLMARLAAIPDGGHAIICVASKVGAASFQGCTVAMVKNKGSGSGCAVSFWV